MISYFRKIRARLAQENKFQSYFRYAIGEILLVVIGILIALQINNWNQKNKSEKEAEFQLSKLKDNLLSDKTHLKTVIALDSAYINNLIFCTKVLANEVIATREEFTSRFQDMFNTNHFDQVRGAFDGLISSGKIELISDQELLDALFLYYNNSGHKSWDSAMADYSRNIIAPYLFNFDHVPNVRNENQEIGFTQFDISKFSVPSKNIEDYKKDQFIINALRVKIQLFEGQKIKYMELEKEINTLIDSLDKLKS